jgi:hypothetical protein
MTFFMFWSSEFLERRRRSLWRSYPSCAYLSVVAQLAAAQGWHVQL